MRLVVGVALAAAAGGAVLAPWAAGAGDPVRLAAWAGFAAVALPTIGGAAWLERAHGRTGHAFLLALGVSMGARMTLALSTLVVAGVRLGPAAVSGAALGIAAAFVPSMIFEGAWFARLRAPLHETRG